MFGFSHVLLCDTLKACFLQLAGTMLPCKRACCTHLDCVAIAGLLPIDGHSRAGTPTPPASPATAAAVHLLCIAGGPGVRPLLIVVVCAAVRCWARCKAILIARRRVHSWPAHASRAPATPPPPAPSPACQESLYIPKH